MLPKKLDFLAIFIKILMGDIPMGLMNWLMKGAGFETEEVYDNSAEKEKIREEKLQKREEKQKLKAEHKSLKTQKRAEKAAKKYSLDVPNKQESSANEKQTNSYFDNPDNFATKYDSPLGDYGPKSSNVGGYGTKNVEFITPMRYDDVAVVIRFLKEGESVMLNLSQMNDVDSQRLLDCAYGAVFALNGNIRRVENNIFFITPEGFNLKSPTNLGGQNGQNVM